MLPLQPVRLKKKKIAICSLTVPLWISVSVGEEGLKPTERQMWQMAIGHKDYDLQVMIDKQGISGHMSISNVARGR